VQPEDVVHVLRNMIASLKPGGAVLDLQVVPPNPIVEAGGEIVCEIDGAPLLAQAAAATAAVDDLVARRCLREQAVDDHEVRNHYRTGSDLIDDFADSGRKIPDDAVPSLLRLGGPVVVRERCRLRRLKSLECVPA
jgi:hypothetical protein